MNVSGQSMALQSAVMLPVLIALSATHLLNDMIQSLIPAIYPIIKSVYGLDFGQVGMITLTFQITASLLQPAVGYYTDRNPMPYSMVIGMGSSLLGLLGLAYAGSYSLLLVAAAFVGLGSSIFHPEATRMARSASGGRHGFAQGVFQVGGQSGSALGPVLAAFIIVPFGQTSIAWFSVAALVAMMLMVWTARTFARVQRAHAATVASAPKPVRNVTPESAPVGSSVLFSLVILMVLLFSKSAYSSSFNSFYTFYLIHKFGVSVQASQMMLFLFLAAAAAGTLGGGILGDKIGRKNIIWFSILGALPFTLILPFANLFWTGVLTVVINLIMSSAFAAILIYAIELLPRRAGMIGGLFYGLSFGLGGLAAVILGEMADYVGIEMLFRICAFLPAIGLLAWFLPSLRSNVR
ncbi:MAG: MFS transporter [Rhizobiales bacterium]|nr:MFS transporter [Hyphomicrobiales bacterium]